MRRALDLGLAAVLVVLVAVGWGRCAGSTRRLTRSSWLQTAGPFVAIGLLLLLLLARVLRRWWMLLPVGLAVAVAATLVVPAFISHASPKRPATSPVMSANLRFGGAMPSRSWTPCASRGSTSSCSPRRPRRRSTASRRRAPAATSPTRWARRPRELHGDAHLVLALRRAVTVAARPRRLTTSRQPEVVVTIRRGRPSGSRPPTQPPRSTATPPSGVTASGRSRPGRTGRRGMSPSCSSGLQQPVRPPGLPPSPRAWSTPSGHAGQGWIRTWPFVGRRIGRSCRSTTC